MIEWKKLRPGCFESTCGRYTVAASYFSESGEFCDWTGTDGDEPVVGRPTLREAKAEMQRYDKKNEAEQVIDYKDKKNWLWDTRENDMFDMYACGPYRLASDMGVEVAVYHGEQWVCLESSMTAARAAVARHAAKNSNTIIEEVTE